MKFLNEAEAGHKSYVIIDFVPSSRSSAQKRSVVHHPVDIIGIMPQRVNVSASTLPRQSGRGVEVRYEVSQEPKDVEPGDIAVMRLVTTKGAVKWTCGTVRCFTDDDEDPAIVLTTGKIPEYDGYELVCRIRPIPDVVQMTLNDDGEVMA